ncbi:YdcF family protein [Cohaesibacter celericrescens]|uniref:DUF218 domain-containing protein n=1 Tax=Cohaesibacter celericrescens TaxID=2067669 RepID=A0A2N5XN12_9HYPH|nr:YdcF family protein [Cohaesibacter celericrescens]PLW75882.1 hypothetical protein C0081_17415 [Cohaesibacter celericrescens]
MIATVFFILSKVVGLFLLVESWLVLGLALALIALWRGSLNYASLTLAATLILLLLVISPLTDIVYYQLERIYPANPELTTGDPIHGIILLGGSAIPNHTQYWNLVELNEAGDRVVQTARLARQWPAAKVLVSGGSASPVSEILQQSIRSEASMTGELLVDIGLDGNRLVLEEKARNTAENATLSAALVGADVTKRWILVTSAFHMPRAMRSFEKSGWSNLVPFPVDHRTDPSRFFSDWYPAGKMNRANHAIKEFVGLIVYQVTGR